MSLLPLFVQLSKYVDPPLPLHVSPKWFGNVAAVAGIEETHGTVVSLEAGSRNVYAAVAHRGLRLRALAAQFADRADIEARTALPAPLAGHVERPSHFAMQAASRESDCPGHHLLLAHAHT